MLKKLFAAVIAATMVLGVVSFASAAAPSFPDTVGIPEETQIATLKALGIVTGDEQGRFNPNGTFTRAQMAVIAMKLLGQGGTAELLNQPTRFPDVEARHSWAWGYINVAVGQGIITGRPDGTFGPDDPATYTDVIVLLLRILNYEPILVGTWPTKYLVKANEVGLTKGISFKADAPATRRNVAVLAYNALTVPKVIQTAYGAEPKYVVSGTENTKEQLLLDNLGAAPVEGWLVSSPEIFGADKDKIQVWVDSNEDGVWDEAEVTIPLAETADVTGLLGRKVKVWKNLDGEAFLVQDVTPASAIKSAYYSSNKVYLSANDKEVDLTGVYCFRNYAGPDEFPGYAPQSGDEITLIYDGNVPRFAVSLNYKTGVVDSVSTVYQRISFQADPPAQPLSLKDWDVRFFGAAEDIGDLQKNDVVQYIDDSANKEAVLIVTRNAPTGVFSKMDSSNFAITVGGVLYKKASGITAASTEYLGKNVKVLLNKSGKYVKVIPLEEVTAPTTTAVILDIVSGVPTTDGVFDYWKLLRADNTKTTLPVDTDLKVYDEAGQDITSTYTLAEGDVIKYEVEDGYITKITVPTRDVEAVHPATLTFATQFKLLGGYLVTDSTAIFEMRDRDGDNDVLDDARAITWSGLKELSNVSGWISAHEDYPTQAEIVVVTRADAAVTADNLYGMVTGKYDYWDSAKNATAKAVSVLIDGEVVDYQFGTVTGTVYSYDQIAEGMVVAFKISAGKADFEVLSEHDPAGDGYEWRIERVDGNLVTLQKYQADGTKVAGSTKQYLIITETSDQLKSKTQYVDYTGDDPVPLTGLSVGLKVQVYSKDVLAGTTLRIANVIVAVP